MTNIDEFDEPEQIPLFQDLPARRVCLKALMQRDPDSSSYRFQYALLLREEGQEQAGQMLLEELASEEDGGYRQAQRLLGVEAMERYGKATDEAEKKTLRRKAIRHLAALGKDRDAPLDYRLGMLYAEDGDVTLAELQLRRSADAGYGAAQMMLSRLQLFAVPSEAMDEVGNWLDQSADEQADDASLWVLRGKLADLNQELQGSEEAYRQAADLDPNFLPELGSFYRRQGNTKQLAETDQRIIDYFEPQLADDPSAQLARAALAESYADQGRWEEARQLLSTVDANPQLQLTLATICTREFDAQLAAISEAGDAQAAPPADSESDESVDAAVEPSPNFELLRTALRSAPDYGPALARLERELYRESSAGRDTVQRMILEMLASGEQPAAIHRLLGLRATWLEDWPTAVSHFEQASRQRPSDAFLRNNLAYSLLKAEQSSSQLRRAKLLATEALQLAPGHPEILATRGEIEVRLNNFEAATTDLEMALKSLPRRLELHRLLAECYDELGPTSLANMHREKANQTDSQPEN